MKLNKGIWVPMILDEIIQCNIEKCFGVLKTDDTCLTNK